MAKKPAPAPDPEEIPGLDRFEAIQQARGRRTAVYSTITLLLLVAALAWFLLKGLPALRRGRAAGDDTTETPGNTPFVRGVDYHPGPADDDGD